MTRPVATYSIVACDLEAGQWGVGGQSKFLAAGSLVPWAEAGVTWVLTDFGPEPTVDAVRAAIDAGP